MPSKQAEHCVPDRWPCHSVRASPPWTTCSPRRDCSSAGTNVGHIRQSCWRCCQQCRCSSGCTCHPDSHGERAANELGRGWSKSFIEHMGFVMTKDTKKAKMLPQNWEELKESYDKLYSFLVYCHLRCSLDGNLVKSC